MTAILARDLFRVHSTPDGEAAALQGLSLTVGDGEVVVVLGPSGAGKTTLLRIVAGLDKPSAGTVRVLGLDVGRARGGTLARYRARTIGYVAQHYGEALTPELSARELVALKLRLLGVPRRQRGRRADELLERVGLAEERTARPHELAGGEQQRVAVCAALVHSPRVLLADEPTGELDAASAAVVYRTIADLTSAAHATALIVSHDAASTRIADRVVRVRDGRVSEEASGDGDAIVVGRGGWARLPEELLARAAIGDRAHAAVEERRLVLTPVTAPAPPLERPDAAAVPFAVGRRQGGRVEVRNVTKTYGGGTSAATPLRALSHSFAARRFHVITGPSGSGKTTLLQLLSGLELPSSGDVELDGQVISSLGRDARAILRGRAIGVVTQQETVIPFLSATENVELALALRGGGRASDDVRGVLAAVGLAERVDHRVSALSAGERARVAIARALAARPAVLVADEPTARLDQANALGITALFRRLADEAGVTVICATHDLIVVEQADAELPLRAGAGPTRGGAGPARCRR